MVSPGSKPAFSAGPPGVTAETSAPATSSSPKLSAMSSVTS